VKRFWTSAEIAATDDGWTVALDGRPIRTPARALLQIPSETLAEAIAAEWSAVEAKVDPRSMPLTGLTNAAIDRIAPAKDAFAAGIAKYAEADLACYRAEGPQGLVDRQAASWGVLLAWARRRYDVDFATTTGIIHVPQPSATVERLAHAVAALDAFRLAALSSLVTIGGSLIAALAVLEDALSAEEAWAAVSVDDAWQLEQWGSDAEAEAALAGRHQAFLAAAEFLELLDAA
jgi:chaperone required for assembly of F1-ATPase